MAKLVSPLKVSLAAYGLALLAGCAMLPPTTHVHQPMTARPQPMPAPPVADGAIYHAENARIALFEDRRARHVGDTLNIHIEEKTTASKAADTNVSRTGSTSLSVPTIFGLPGKTFQGASLDASSANKFEGKGASSSNNLFTGDITVTVIQVLANGNLLVSGEKEISINQGDEHIRFSGVVNPAMIDGTNTVSSTKVADARLEYKGSGYIDEAQTMGWLARFFLSVLPF